VADCTYELYALTFKAARAAVRSGDGARLVAMRARAGCRPGGAAAACLLALDDAEANASRRTKFEVCRPLCDTRCERGV
jgi:hypothetical protein